MGYSTDFSGSFDLDKKLTDEHYAYLEKFADTRRMQRDANTAKSLPDPLRIAVGLPMGAEGGYFVGGNGLSGQDTDKSVKNGNMPPKGQPGLWCQWIPQTNDKGQSSIEWDGGEKFYEYIPWIKYLIKHFLEPWGYVVNGQVKWQGEEMDDRGVIMVENNVVTERDLE